MKDLEEFKNNKNIGKFCKIILNDYSKIENINQFQLIIELVSHFTLKFIFTQDYPFEPPKISFFKGNQYDYLFDSEGNILLDIIRKENWTPTFWISTLIYHIELKIQLETNKITNFNKDDQYYYNYNNERIIFIKKQEYNKRNWTDYLNGIQKKDSIAYLENSELKQIKNYYNDFNNIF